MSIKAFDIKKKINVTILQFVASSAAGIVMAVCLTDEGTLYEAGIKNLIVDKNSL